jgi:ubiquinone/menaquinone biosynthesis C-methylase UbiE
VATRQPPPEVAAYYDAFAEEDRLSSGASQLEFERTKEILGRVLPPPPAVIVDVGGAAGSYSLWLAGLGYEVHLVDASPRLVEKARQRSARHAHAVASVTVGDARALPQADGSAAAVLVLGPLYHLTEPHDRLAALGEALRVLAPGGVVAAAAISRYASALAGLAQNLSLDPRFVEIRDRDLATGQHRNDTGRIEYFTTAYFHRPEDLRGELERAGFGGVQVLGVEGLGEWLTDFDERWADPAKRRDLLEVARRLEAEPSIVGMSAHLLAIGRKVS